MVIMTAVPNARQVAENPYHDRVEGEVLVYTGAGREGDQTLAGMNKRIPQQVQSGFPVYGFTAVASRRDRSVGRKRWEFLGLLEYLRHYREAQLDVRKNLRSVWLFELFVHADPSIVPVANERQLTTELVAAGKALASGMPGDREIGGSSSGDTAVCEASDAVAVESERSRLLTVSPSEFEHIVRNVLIRTGFERVHVTRYSQDGGIDVDAFAGKGMWPLRDLRLQVQAKRWLHTVGRKEVAELRGSLQPFARGAVVTTSHFSRAAIVEANDVGKNPITLVDGYSFARLTRAIRESLNP